MAKKKIEVVELNKKEEEIILEEGQSGLILFWRRYRGIIFFMLMVLSLLVLGTSLFLFIKNLNLSEEPIVKKATIDISLDDLNISTSKRSLDDESAKNTFLRNGEFKTKGEVLLVKKTEHSKFIINYYSDGTALKIMKDGSKVIRINPLANGDYGIDNDGTINKDAPTSETQIAKTKTFPWGKVTYLTDGSAIVDNSKMDIFVRDSSDVNDNYVSDNKVTYLKETKKVGTIKLNYYYDGTIEVVKNGKSYLVRNESDLNITGNDVTFNNSNQAEIYATKKTKDGYVIDYYTDGGAIIKDGNKTLSVRKSNSIVVQNDKLIEIVDSIYVTISKKEGNATYFTNGGAIVEKYNGKTIYVPENSDIKYRNNKISDVGNKVERLANEKTGSNSNVKEFEHTAVIKNPEYTAIVPKESVIYDDDGNVKPPDVEEPQNNDDIKEFTITNNSNEDLRYRVVIEESKKTTVNVQYLRYQLSTGSEYVEPNKLSNKLWANDYVSKGLNVKGKNYILIDDTIDAGASEKISLMLWTDYDTIPNSEMDKYFYGTIRVYAWTEEDKD